MGRFEKCDRFKGGDWYEYTEENSHGERLLVHITECDSDGRAEQWFELGYTDRVLGTYLNVSTYVTRGGCIYGGYNPTCYMHGTELMLDFAWLLEAGEESKRKVLEEIERRFKDA